VLQRLNSTQQKSARGTLVGKMHKQNGDFRISINEMMVKVGETKEGLDVLDFPGFWAVLDVLEFVWGHGEAFRRQYISEVFSGSDMELPFVCMGKKYVSEELSEYFLDVGFVFGNVIRTNEDVIQIDDDNDVDHVCKGVVHKMLESCW